MPNYTINTLIVSGETRNLRRFRDDARGIECDLSLNALLPMPAELEDTDAEDEGRNWYNWRVDNWGTKWDVDGKLSSDFPDCLEYAFRSAWNPPVEWLKQVSKDYPTLRFRLRYVEESDEFTGIARVQNGRVDDKRLNLDGFEGGGDTLRDRLSDWTESAVEACAKITHRISSLLPEGR